MTKLLETVPEMSRGSLNRASAAAERACKYLLAHILLENQSIFTQPQAVQLSL